MHYYFTLKYLTFLMFVQVVKARSHKYSLASSSSEKYTDISAYFENTSTMQCMALCDEHDNCSSISYNLDTRRCELTPRVPRAQTPASAVEPNWRVYHKDRIIPATDAWQQSTYSEQNIPMLASYAIDGNRDNNFPGTYCAHTNEGNSYWAMEFKYVAEVEYVMIYFRNDTGNNKRNNNLRLLISTTRQDSDNNNGTECATYLGPPASASPPTKITCTRPVTGKFLKIIHEQDTVLTLCEVEALVTVGSWTYKSITDAIDRRNVYSDDCLRHASDGQSGARLGLYQIHTYDTLLIYLPHDPFMVEANIYKLKKPLIIGEFSQKRGGLMTSPKQFTWAYYHGYNGAWSWSAVDSDDASDTIAVQEAGLRSLKDKNDQSKDGRVNIQSKGGRVNINIQETCVAKSVLYVMFGYMAWIIDAVFIL